MYRDGLGVKQDYAKSLAYFLVAAEQGFLDAMYQAALCFEQGRGTIVNDERADYWMNKAADSGLKLAIEYRQAQ